MSGVRGYNFRDAVPNHAHVNCPALQTRGRRRPRRYSHRSRGVSARFGADLHAQSAPQTGVRRSEIELTAAAESETEQIAHEFGKCGMLALCGAICRGCRHRVHGGRGTVRKARSLFDAVARPSAAELASMISVLSTSTI